MVTAAQLLLVSTTLWHTPTMEATVAGKATYMAPGRMREVLANRPHYDLAGFAGPVALNRAGDLGRTVWLEWPDGTVDGPMLVVDCAQRGEHFLVREEQDRVAEVSAELAGERDFYGLGPVPVVVWFVDPRPMLARIY